MIKRGQKSLEAFAKELTQNTALVAELDDIATGQKGKPNSPIVDMARKRLAEGMPKDEH